jgi:hypothetical protein
MQPTIFPESGAEIGNATGLYPNSNPPYAISDFLAVYPQFGTSSTGTQVIPTTIIQNFINMATSSLNQARWQDLWMMGMPLYVAHFCSLYLQTMASADDATAVIRERGTAVGFTTEEHAKDMSVTKTYAGAQKGSQPSNWELTAFGQQLKSLSTMVGMGEMYVW